MRTRTLLALSALALGLLLLALFDPWEEPLSSPLGRLLPAESLSRVLLETSEGGRYELRLEDSPSVRVGDDPMWHRADRASAQSLVSALALLRSSRRESVASHHGFADPVGTIDFECVSGTHGQLIVGAQSPDGKHHWVRLVLPTSSQQPGDDALLVEAHLIAEVLAAQQTLVSRRVLAKRPGPHSQLRLQLGEQWLRVAETLVWWPEHSQALSESRYAELRDLLGSLESQEGPCDGATMALTVDQEHHTLREACVSPGVWQELAELVRRPMQLMVQATLPAREAPERFALRCGENLIEISAGSDADRVQSWWQAVDFGAVGVESLSDFTLRCIVHTDQGEVEFGTSRAEPSSWFARVEGDLVRRLRLEVAPLLQAPPSRFLGLGLIGEDPLFATRIRIEDSKRTLTLLRTELIDAWQESGNALSEEVASQVAVRLRSELASLRVVRFVANEESPVTARDVQIDFEQPVSGTTAHYKLKLWRHGEGCLAKLGKGPPGELAANHCQALLAPLPATE